MRQDSLIRSNVYSTTNQDKGPQTEPRHTLEQLQNDYDPNGSDLHVASFEERYYYAESYLLHGIASAGYQKDELLTRANALLAELYDEAKHDHEEQQLRHSKLTQKNFAISQAVGAWVDAEAEKRIISGAYGDLPSDELLTIVTLDSLNALEDELKSEGELEPEDAAEYRKLVKIINIRRSDIVATLKMVDVDSLRKQAAAHPVELAA